MTTEYDFFKSREAVYKTSLEKNAIYAVRLDGKNFGSFTKQYEAPYDERFAHSMDESAKTVMAEVFPNALLAYVQSDEMTIFFTDKISKKAQLPFDGKTEKILSIAASAATAGFFKSDANFTGVPLFDARLLKLEDVGDVLRYTHWRRLDARKNAISMAAECVYDHKELLGKSTKERMLMLENTPYETLPEEFFNGRLIVKQLQPTVSNYTHKLTGVLHEVEHEAKVQVTIAATKERTEEEVTRLLTRIV